MEFFGRADPARTLASWLEGKGLRTPLSVISLSGPGGIGKTFLLEHAIRTADLSTRGYLRLSIAGSTEARTVGQLVGHDLLQSCSQLDATGADFFLETRKNLEALRYIDERARAEVVEITRDDVNMRQTLLELSRLGAGLHGALPFLKNYVDLGKVRLEHVEAAVVLLKKAKAYQQERRVLGGVLPDLLGKGRRNRLRANVSSAIADGLVADLAAILGGYRPDDRTKPMPAKVPGLDRLLLVFDDFESLAEWLNPFLGDHLVPLLARASFETVLVVLGRDRLSDTHPVWRQRHDALLVGELKLSAFDRDEAEAFIRENGITDATIAQRILDDTAGYPYLLAGEVSAELDGVRTALGLKSFYDRTTRWMTKSQRNWLVPLCFLDEINLETVATMLPDDDAERVLDWFKSEASVRSPVATKWEVLPIIRSKVCAYLKLDSPKRYRDLEARAGRANAP